MNIFFIKEFIRIHSNNFLAYLQLIILHNFLLNRKRSSYHMNYSLSEMSPEACNKEEWVKLYLSLQRSVIIFMSSHN